MRGKEKVQQTRGHNTNPAPSVSQITDFISLKTAIKSRLKTPSAAALLAVSFSSQKCFIFLFILCSEQCRVRRGAMNNSGPLLPGQKPLSAQVCLLTSSLPSPCPLPPFLLFTRCLSSSLRPTTLVDQPVCAPSLSSSPSLSVSSRSPPSSSLSGHVSPSISLFSSFHVLSLPAPFGWKMFRLKWSKIQTDLLSERHEKNSL